MAKSNAASDTELSLLHSAVAKAFIRQLDGANRATELLDMYIDSLPQEIIEYLSEQKEASPSLLTAATKFLKDNDITCQIEDSTEMRSLERRLHEKKSSVGIPDDHIPDMFGAASQIQ